MNNKITRRQYIAILLSSLIGIGILSLSADVCKIAKQDGWISTIIGGLFPLYILLIAAYIHNKMNYNDFWNITNDLYGKYISYFIFLVFMISSLFYQASVITEYIRVLKSSIAPFVPDIILVGLVIFLTVNTSKKGLTLIARLCEFSIYFIVPLLLLPIIFIPKGNITNVQPLFSSGKNILSAAPKGLLAYSGTEVAFILLHYITNEKKAKKSAIIVTSIITFLYTLTVFITIYYLGWQLTSKTDFPLLLIYELIKVPILSDSKALFILVWSNAIFITLNIYQFNFSYCASKLSKYDFKKTSYIMGIFVFGLSLYTSYNNNFKIKFIDVLTNYLSVFIVLWVALSFILVYFKSRGEKR